MKIFRVFSQSNLITDQKISRLPGGFDRMTPADLKKVFNIRYNSLENTKLLDLPTPNPNRLTQESQEFFLNAFIRFNSSLPPDQSIGQRPNSFKGNYTNMCSLIEFFIRALVMAGYESGITVSLSDPILTKSGLSKGKHEINIYRGNCPIILIRPGKLIPQQSSSALEQSFTSLIFSLYTEYQNSPIWPLYGILSDINTWEFLKYDGTSFYRSPPLPLFLESTALHSLSHTILQILDSSS
jgi:hypothetical protein